MRMNIERLGAFNDAVLAIVMTIIVLEFEVPSPLTLESLLGLLPHVFAYAVSFFWLGAMWVNQHNLWQSLKYVRPRSMWADLLMLFFSSFFPLTTHMVANNFTSPIAQVTYGVVVLCVTAANTLMYRALMTDNPEVAGRGLSSMGVNWRMRTDVAIKLVGLALSATVFPPGTLCAVLVTLLFYVIPPQLANVGGE